MTREEHLEACKRRALAYLPANPLEAMASMISDLRNHPELENHVGLLIAPTFYGRHNDAQEVRRWIEGFN